MYMYFGAIISVRMYDLTVLCFFSCQNAILMTGITKNYNFAHVQDNSKIRSIMQCKIMSSGCK